MLQVDPCEIVFSDQKNNLNSQKSIKIINTGESPLELNIKPISTERYSVIPAKLNLRPQQRAYIDVRLKLAPSQIKRDYNDYLIIKTDVFDRKVPIKVKHDAGDAKKANEKASSYVYGNQNLPPSPARKSRGSISYKNSNENTSNFNERESAKDDDFKKRSLSSFDKQRNDTYNSNKNYGQSSPKDSFYKVSKTEYSDAIDRSDDYEKHALRKRIKLLESDLLERDKQLNIESFEKGDLKLRLNEYHDKVFFQEQKLDEVNKQCMESEREIEKNNLMNGYLNEFKIIAQDENPELSKCLDLMLHEEKLNWEKKTNEILMTLREKEDDITSLEKKLNMLMQGEQTVQEDFEFFKEENQRHVLEIEDLKNGLEIRDQEIIDLKINMEEMDIDYDKVKNDKYILQDELEDKYKEMGAYVYKDRSLLDKNIDLEAQLKNMKHMYDSLQEKYAHTKKGSDSQKQLNECQINKEAKNDNSKDKLIIEFEKRNSENMLQKKKLMAYEESLCLIKEMLDNFTLDRVYDLKEFEKQKNEISDRIHDVMLYDTLKQPSFAKSYDLGYPQVEQLEKYETMLFDEKNKLEELSGEHRKLMEQQSNIKDDRDYLKKELDKRNSSSGKIFEEALYKGDKHSNYLSNTNKSSNYRENANDLQNPMYYDVDMYRSGEGLKEDMLLDERKSMSNEREKLFSKISELEIKLKLNKETWTQEREDWFKERDSLMHERDLLEVKISKLKRDSVENKPLKNKDDEETNLTNYGNELFGDANRNISQMLRKRINTLETEINDQSKTCEKLRSKNDDLRGENESLRYEIDQGRKENKDEMVLLDDKNIEISHLRKKNKLVEDEINRRDNLIEKKNCMIEKFQDELKETNDRVLLMTQQISERNNLISELNSKVKEMSRNEENNTEELEGRRKQVDLLEHYKEELEKEIEERNMNYESNNDDFTCQITSKDQELKNTQRDIERLKDCVCKYELEFSNLEKDKKILEMEVKELRINVLDKDKDTEMYKIELFNLKQIQYKGDNEKEKKVSDLEGLVKAFTTQKKEMKEEFTKEIERMIGFHKQALDLLKEENRCLDDRYRKELDDRKLEIEKYKDLERKYSLADEEMNPRKRNSSDGRIHNGRDSEKLEQELIQKRHELIDINMDLDKIQRIKSEFEEKYKRENKLRLELADELGLAKQRNRELKEKCSKIDFINKMEQKTEVELLKEMNDLREIVEELKIERDKMIDELRQNNLLTSDDLRLREISSENLLSYIKQLIEEKTSLNHNISSQQAEIREISGKSDQLEKLVAMYKNDNDRYREEYAEAKKCYDTVQQKYDDKCDEGTDLKAQLSKTEGLGEIEMKKLKLEYEASKKTNQNIVSQNSSLVDQLKEQSSIHEDSLRTNDLIVQLTKEKFANDLMDLQVKFGIITAGNVNTQVKEKLRDALLKFLENGNSYIHKESKIKSMEELIKKQHSKIQVLKESKKKLKIKVQTALEEMDKLSKKAATMNKNLHSVSTMVKTKEPKEKKKKDEAKENNKNNANQEKQYDSRVVTMDKNDKDKIQLIHLESELISSQNKQKNSIKNTELLNDHIEYYKKQLREKDDQIKDLLTENKKLSKEMSDYIKKWKQELEKRPDLLAETKKIVELEEKVSDLEAKNKKYEEEKEKSKKTFENYQSLKKNKEHLSGDYKKLEDENNNLKEEINKLQKLIKQAKNREKMFDEYRKDFETMRNSEKENKKKLDLQDQKISGMKQDISNKDKVQKDLREKRDKLESTINEYKKTEQELEKNKIVLKKTKIDMERKEQQADSYKNQLTTYMNKLNDLEKTQDSNHKDTIAKGILALNEKESKKIKELNSKIYEKNNIIQRFSMILSRLYKENLFMLQKEKTEFNDNNNTMANDITRYSESLDVLGLKADDIGQFLHSKVEKAKNREDGLLKNFEDELNNSENMDFGQIFKRIAELVEERIAIKE